MSTTVTELYKVKTGRWNGGRSPFNVEYGKIMMWFFLTSDAFTFSAFLIYYGSQRFAHMTWVDPDKVFQSIPFVADYGYPLVFVGIMTFILIMSSVTMVLAVERSEEPRLNSSHVKISYAVFCLKKKRIRH